MAGYLPEIPHGCCLAIAAALIAVVAAAEIPAEVESVENAPGLDSETIRGLAARNHMVMNSDHEQGMKLVAGHDVADPVALVAAVRDSPMANLLISVAIEESRGNPVAVGSAGERGAWQVKASAWGLVPKDIYGQAAQAERIITNLMIHTKGNRKKALAHYNGGTTPPGRSYRYAEKVLKRAGNLQAAFNQLPQSYSRLKTALLFLPDNTSRVL